MRVAEGSCNWERKDTRRRDSARPRSGASVTALFVARRGPRSKKRASPRLAAPRRTPKRRIAERNTPSTSPPARASLKNAPRPARSPALPADLIRPPTPEGAGRDSYPCAPEGAFFSYAPARAAKSSSARGAGEYELLVYCPEGPYFYTFYGFAVDQRGRILGVGGETSLYYDGDRWVLESLPDKNGFEDVTAGLSGFYAVATNGMSMPQTIELLYHP